MVFLPLHSFKSQIQRRFFPVWRSLSEGGTRHFSWIEVEARCGGGGLRCISSHARVQLEFSFPESGGSQLAHKRQAFKLTAGISWTGRNEAYAMSKKNKNKKKNGGMDARARPENSLFSCS